MNLDEVRWERETVRGRSSAVDSKSKMITVNEFNVSIVPKNDQMGKATG